MEKQCTICEKKSGLRWNLEKLRGKYNPTTKKRQYPNLQWLNVPKDIKKKAYFKFAGKKIKACAKCIKAIAKTK